VPCVLIVEDDADVREFMDLLLSNSGFETETAANGAEALEAVRARRP
jgi:CheY-like chemotaxis protein